MAMLPRGPLTASATLATCLLLTACAATDNAPPTPSASASGIVVGEPEGEAFPVETPSPAPTGTLPPTPSPAIAPAADGFNALVAACALVADGTCQGQLNSLDGATRFVALVSFSAANRGDIIEAVLEGPSGPLRTGPYALQGSGAGYYYAEFSLPSLAPGKIGRAHV